MQSMEIAGKDSTVQKTVPGRLGVARIAAFSLLAIAFAFYVPLIVRIKERTETLAYFSQALLPIALAHTLLFLLVYKLLRIGARGAIIFWGISGAVFLVLGGLPAISAFAEALAFGLILILIGMSIAKYILPEDSMHWSVALGMGILSTSVVGAYMASTHLFRWFILAPILMWLLYHLGWRRRRVWVGFLKEGWLKFSEGWDLPHALSLQGCFLLLLFVFVAGMAPDTNSDAIRFYWPYIKWLRHDGGFLQIAQQWSYIIPQAGLTYAGVLLSLGGSPLARLSMLLAWLALAGILLRRKSGTVGNVSVALVMASCPVVLWTAPSLMQDAFVSMAVVMLALVCLEAKNPGSSRFWIAVGAFSGMAYAAKFSTLAYAAPLVLAASWRCYRGFGLGRILKGYLWAVPGGIAVILPWLIHSYRQSGNPVFPFFLNIFPAPLWPNGIGKVNLDSFTLPPGPRGWFLWPIDLTYHTSRFVEGYDGKLGLLLILLIILALPVLRRGNTLSRALIVSAVVGTGLLWSQTAYLRYWVPGLWLLAIAVMYGVPRLVQSKAAHLCFAALAIVILLAQILHAMLGTWADPKGWAWSFYSGKVNQNAYLDQSFSGFEKLHSLNVFENNWPKIWFTGFEAIGYLPVRPLEATAWELDLHERDPRRQISYLGSAGCDYWVINEHGADTYWLRASGMPLVYWDENNLLASAGPIKVYRMKKSDEALRDFDARARPGSELIMDGGFEQNIIGVMKYWRQDGEAKWLDESPEALEGKECMKLEPRASLRQQVSLPYGLKEIELTLSARSAVPERSANLYIELNVLGFGSNAETSKQGSNARPEDLLNRESIVESTLASWREYRIIASIPVEARYAVVTIGNKDSLGAAIVDAVHLRSR